MNEIKDVVENPFELLRQKLDKWPIRAPKAPEIIKILKEMYTEEEAKLLSYFEMPFVDRVNPKELALRSGLSFDKVVEMLDSIASKALIFRLGQSKKRSKYALWPFVLGLYEMFFSNAKSFPEEKVKKVGKLWEKYYDRHLLHVAGASTYPFPRVLPAKTSEKVIEINKDIEAPSQRILVFEELEEILDNYVAYGVMPCSCRTEHEYLGDACNKPKETCMVFDMIAEFLIDVGVAKRLTKEEALSLLKECEKNGLVHMTLNAQIPNFICNCCNDCCGILKSITKFHRSGMFAKSNFEPYYSEEIKCNQCFACFDNCPTKAILPIIEPGKETIFEIDKDLCIGCGICSSKCPTKKIKLRKVRNHVPEKTTPDAYARYAEERYRYKKV
ncbi:MAG: 4Fe-4S binding protein [Promethearchaeota archaeon]